MKKLRKKMFSIIEIALAIGILAIGMVAIMAVFPVALKEDNESVVQKYSPIISESVFAYIAQVSKHESDWSASGIIYDLPSAKPIRDADSTISSSNLEATDVENIYEVDNAEGEHISGVYAATIKSGDHTDIAGEVLIWKSNLKKVYFGGSNVLDEQANAFDNSAVAINLEISFPMEKPYSQRVKNTYYLELFNYDVTKNNPPEDVEEGPIFEENDGVVELPAAKVISLKVLGSEFSGRRGYPVNVNVSVNITYADNTSKDISVFSPAGQNDVWSKSVSAGTTFTISADFNEVGGYGERTWTSTNTKQVISLADGDVPAPYKSFGNQPPVEDFLEAYIDTQTKQMILEENQIIYLFELGRTNTNDPGFDLQDLVVLATFLPEETAERIELAAELATAQESYNAAEALVNAAEVTLDDAVSYYNSKRNDYNNKVSIYNYWERKYNRRRTSYRLRKRNQAQTAMNSAETVKNTAASAQTAAQVTLEQTQSNLSAAQTELDAAQVAYNAAK